MKHRYHWDDLPTIRTLNAHASDFIGSYHTNWWRECTLSQKNMRSKQLERTKPALPKIALTYSKDFNGNFTNLHYRIFSCSKIKYLPLKIFSLYSLSNGSRGSALLAVGLLKFLHKFKKQLQKKKSMNNYWTQTHNFWPKKFRNHLSLVAVKHLILHSSLLIKFWLFLD